MYDPRDPVEAAADSATDLYGIATWEPRSAVDRLSTFVYRAVVGVLRLVVVLLAAAIVVAQLVSIALATAASTAIGVFTLLSVIPALAIAVYVWQADVTRREPLRLLVVTYLLGIVLAGFAAVLNSLAQPAFAYVPVVGLALFFYVVVGPVEETVKWLAIRLHAFRSDDFDAVIDGAVYGAMAGLGFATIENAIYIGGQYADAVEAGTAAAPLFEAALPTAAVRTFAGPGHVLYSAVAGYYLGLAKFNRQYAGPIVVKGILVAAFIHATYNTIATYLPVILHLAGITIPAMLAFLGFVVVYDGIVALYLYRKIARYRRAFRTSGAGTDGSRLR